VELPTQIRDAMVAHARFCAPAEACGLLAFDDDGRMRMVYALTNIEESPVAFTVDPDEHIRALRHAESRGWHLGGVFHSHTRTPAYPSDTDVGRAAEPGWLHVLVSLERDTEDVRGFWIEAGEVIEEPLVSPKGGDDHARVAGRSGEKPPALDAAQRLRYSRHLLLSEIGESGQLRLLSSRVLVVGAGGLGSPAALYLAAAGVGRLGIVDFDTVEETNLQRQILHTPDRIGRPKVESAAEALRRLNPDVEVETYPVRLSADTVLSIAEGYDVIVDGADNYPTRYLINDASLHLRVPVVHGSIFRCEGRITLFRPYDGPCYRCLFPEPPPPPLRSSCAEVGVLAVLPGVVGSVQAAEAVKLLVGIGESLAGRLLLYDALTQSFQAVTLQRDPECRACGDEARPPRLVDYDDACRPGGTVRRSS
jgi:molybdopterin/thiamine biosynthesis adenylyltransferase/proteasome lid subunit RPN8/RPN11